MAPHIEPQKIADFRHEIWRHYKKHKRDFPWRKTRDPYEILISEFMLQQTQVSRVMQKYEPFLKRFPDFRMLAHAPLRAVLQEWQGLGYNRRAVNLKRLAEIVMRDYEGILPNDVEKLKSLPGVGQSTAGAVMAFAFNKPAIFIETNIRRVFIHFFFPKKRAVRDEEILTILKKVINSLRSLQNDNTPLWRKDLWRAWYWALYDYGAMLGSSRPFGVTPKGRDKRERIKNPNRRSAHYKKQSKFEGSRRQLRGEILRLLLTKPSTKEELFQRSKRPAEEILNVLQELEREKVIKISQNKFSIA